MVTPPADAARLDAHPVVPFNMPGMVYCYGTLTCSTTSATPLCCDAEGSDGGFSDTCVADVPTCTATDATAKTFQCGQAADCGAGMVCCGSLGTATSGSSFFNSTTCAASCPAGDTQLCVADGECQTSGTTCMAKDISGRAVGLCQ